MEVVTEDLIQFKPSLIKLWQVTRLSLRVFQCSSFTICYIILIVLLNSDNELICNLAWDEKCMSPQDNTRRVTTASNLQIREGVYQGSSKQWKKFQPYLNGMLDNINT